MHELWTPRPDKHPDVSNIYDMMMVFQETLDAHEDIKDKIKTAEFAIKALGRGLMLMDEETKQVSVVTNFVVLDSVEKD